MCRNEFVPRKKQIIKLILKNFPCTCIMHLTAAWSILLTAISPQVYFVQWSLLPGKCVYDCSIWDCTLNWDFPSSIILCHDLKEATLSQIPISICGDNTFPTRLLWRTLYSPKLLFKWLLLWTLYTALQMYIIVIVVIIIIIFSSSTSCSRSSIDDDDLPEYL